MHVIALIDDAAVIRRSHDYIGLQSPVPSQEGGMYATASPFHRSAGRHRGVWWKLTAPVPAKLFGELKVASVDET